MLVFALAAAYFMKPGRRSDAPVLTEFASEKEVGYNVGPTWTRRRVSYKLSGVSFEEAAAAVKELESEGCKFSRLSVPLKQGDREIGRSERAYCNDQSRGKGVGVTLWTSSGEIKLDVWEPIPLNSLELRRARKEQITVSGPPVRSKP